MASLFSYIFYKFLALNFLFFCTLEAIKALPLSLETAIVVLSPVTGKVSINLSRLALKVRWLSSYGNELSARDAWGWWRPPKFLDNETTEASEPQSLPPLFWSYMEINLDGYRFLLIIYMILSGEAGEGISVLLPNS